MRVDHKQRFRMLVLQQLRNGFNIVASAGGGFVRLHEDGASLQLERTFDLIERKGLPIGSADQVHLAAESLGES